MHARKLPRISEPSFDRDYGNGSSSGSKVSKYRDRRSVSPDGRGMSPRDRSKYGRRDRDRDRERERDYYRDRDRRRRDRSPKDRKWDRRDRDRMLERDRDDRLDHRDSHHQSSGSGGGSDVKVRSVGNWSEHTSSSGKIYYYNCVTEVSQWEKPREWVDFERQRTAALKSSQERRSMSQKSHLLSRDRSMRDLDYDDRGRSDQDLDPRLHSRDQQDMDISSSHDTTPTSDESQRHNHHQRHQQQQQESHHHYYDDQDKTPPPAQDHPSADGTPSPPGGQTLTPTQNEANEQPTNTAVGNLMMNSGLVASSPLTALKPQVPALTSSLARFYKESLIGHVTNWPAEAVERSCQRINEEHLNLSNLGITRVSTELKMARSLVRLAEIQSTLHEQRTLFLRQQILDLEDMKPRVALHYMQSSENTSLGSSQPTSNAQIEQNQQSSSPALQPIVTSNA